MPKLLRVQDITKISPKQKLALTWRAVLRAEVGPNGEEIIRILLDIARGRSVLTELPDGRQGPPIVPSSADRRAAATELAHMLFGVPVPQTQVVAAEEEATDMSAIRALSDGELAKQAREALAELEDAEVVPADAHALPEGDA